MKTTILALLCLLTMLTGAAASAQESPVLGTSHYSVELAYMFAQHRTWTPDDYGIYLGIAGYGHIGNDWYLGGETGVGASMGFFGWESSSFTPIEVNAKHGYALSRHWVADLGGGLCTGRVKIVDNNLFSEDDIVSDWVFGGQVLANIVFQSSIARVGFKIKYQLTTDVAGAEDIVAADEGWDYTNFKISAQIGFLIPD